MTTIAEQLHSQGRSEGRAQGRSEGRSEGRAEGAARLLLRALRSRGLVVNAEAEQRIRACTELSTLERWLDRALVASSVDEVFEDALRTQS